MRCESKLRVNLLTKLLISVLECKRTFTETLKLPTVERLKDLWTWLDTSCNSKMVHFSF